MSKTNNTPALFKSDASKFGVSEIKANTLKLAFTPDKIKAQELLPAYTEVLTKDIDSEETAKEAREIRLKMVKVRSSISSTHTLEKAEFLGSGKLCDALKNELINELKEQEANLLKIEKHRELLEEQRLNNLQDERAQALSEFVEDAHEKDLKNMDEEVWEAYFTTAKNKHKAKLKAEKEEKEAIKRAEIKEKLNTERKNKLIPFWKFMEPENIGLNYGELEEKAFEGILKNVKEKDSIEKKALAKQKAENEALQVKLQKAEEERVKKAAKEKKEKDALLATIKKNEEAKRKEAEAKAKAEAQLLADEEARKQAELSKSDSAKVLDLINGFTTLKTKFTFTSEKNIKMYKGVGETIDKITTQLSKYK